MRKRVFGRKLSRDYGARRALFRSLVRALILYGAIKTTKAKAKAIQGEVEKMVKMAKEGGVSHKRQIYAFLGNDREIADLVFDVVASGFSARNSGYTRIVNLPKRLGDRAEMVRFEWSEKIVTSEKGKVTSDKKKVKQSTKKNTEKDKARK